MRFRPDICDIIREYDREKREVWKDNKSAPEKDKDVGGMEDAEDNLELRLIFGKEGLVPVVTHDTKTKEVLMLSSANK